MPTYVEEELALFILFYFISTSQSGETFKNYTSMGSEEEQNVCKATIQATIHYIRTAINSA